MSIVGFTTNSEQDVVTPARWLLQSPGTDARCKVYSKPSQASEASCRVYTVHCTVLRCTPGTEAHWLLQVDVSLV